MFDDAQFYKLITVLYKFPKYKYLILNFGDCTCTVWCLVRRMGGLSPPILAAENKKYFIFYFYNWNKPKIRSPPPPNPL